jgi:SMP-30/Gluconolactonase/LRE-like region
VAPAAAWDRGEVETFAVLPAGSTGPEGLTVGFDGNVYATTFGFNSTGAVTTPSQLLVFRPNGSLLRQVSIQNASPHTLGLAFNPVTGGLIVLDFGSGTALALDPKTGHSSLFMTASTTGVPDSNVPGTDKSKAGLNALTFDRSGNVYISDSFQGIIWKVGPNGGTGPQRLGTIWVQDATLTTTGVPPFGANGVEFNNAETALFVANTGNDTVVKIPVSNGAPGTPAVLTNSINGADGIVLDADDNIWVVANQSDEIVIIDPTGKVIAKLGDFDGLDKKGVPRGLLFPASPAFSRDGKFLYVSNLALDLRFAGGPQTVDSQWGDEVQRYTISRLRARIPPLRGSDAD